MLSESWVILDFAVYQKVIENEFMYLCNMRSKTGFSASKTGFSGRETMPSWWIVKAVGSEARGCLCLTWYPTILSPEKVDEMKCLLWAPGLGLFSLNPCRLWPERKCSDEVCEVEGIAFWAFSFVCATLVGSVFLTNRVCSIWIKLEPWVSNAIQQHSL